MFVCFITKALDESKNCNLEIEYASSLNKRIVVLMIERLKIEDLGAVGFIIKYFKIWNNKKLTMYKSNF